MTEKPGFKGAGLPGKAQPHNRSGGVKSCRVYADSKGV